MLEKIKQKDLERSIYWFRNNTITSHLRGSFNEDLYKKIKNLRK